MPPSYEDFFLVINGQPGAYTVEAQGPGEVRVPPVPFEYQETDELRIELNRIQEGFAPSRERMQSVGGLLFNALFPRAIIRAFERAPSALPERVKLRVKLVVRPPELSGLPWELMYDPDQQVFLAARLSYPIVRFVESGTPAASLLAGRPLRVLYVGASPSDTPPLDIMASERALRDALGADAEITSLHTTTPSALRDALRQPSGFHILHYDGHAAFDAESDAGHLYLHDREGKSYPLSGEMLATFLDGTSLRLVVLSACETAMDSKQQRFSGIAQQLMRASSLPAVVAMQFTVADASAVAFTRGFYQALADDYPVDAATVEGRKAILEMLGGDAQAFAAPDWATPVLFMRSKDGDIFREELPEVETEPPPASQPGVTAAGERSVAIGSEVRDSAIITGDQVIHTGGGAFVGGNVTAGGDFVGRDQVKIVGPGAADLAQWFEKLYADVEARPDTSPADKDDLKAELRDLQAEVIRGDQADESFLARRLRNIQRMAPDILDVVLATLSNPAAGFASVVKKVAQRIKGSAGGGNA